MADTELIIDQGDDETIDITVTDPPVPPATVGGPTDLSNCKLWFYVKRHAGDADADAIITKTSETGEGITINEDPKTGLAEIAIDPTDTASLDAAYLDKSLKWALQLKDAATPEPHVTTLARGTVLIRRDLIVSTA